MKTLLDNFAPVNNASELELPQPPMLTRLDGSSKSAPDLVNNPAMIYLASLRESGRRSMMHHLNVIADMVWPGSNALTFPWHELTSEQTIVLHTKLHARYAPATANTAVKAMRRTLKEAFKLGQMSLEAYNQAIKLPVIKSENSTCGHALDHNELKKLINSCNNDTAPAGVRDAAIIAVAYSGGLRRSEVAALNRDDYNPQECTLISFGAKGGKDRLVYIGPGGAAALTDWLIVRGDIPGAFFNPISKGGNVAIGKRMTAQSIMVAVKKRCKEAGLQKFTPDDLRRTFFSDLINAGTDIATVQKIAGHVKVETTARYDQRDEAAKQKVETTAKPDRYSEAAKQKAAGLVYFPYLQRRLPLE